MHPMADTVMGKVLHKRPVVADFIIFISLVPKWPSSRQLVIVQHVADVLPIHYKQRKATVVYPYQ